MQKLGSDRNVKSRNREKAVEVAVALLCRRGCVWVQQRLGNQHLSGHWEFPGGKIRSGETALEAVRREVFEEVGVRLSNRALQLFFVRDFQYPERRIRIHFFLCRTSFAEPRGEGRWVTLEILKQLPVPAANRPVVDRLSYLLQGGPAAAPSETPAAGGLHS